MAVARSYESLEQLGEPFEENKKMYVMVRTKAGAEKKVRWYSESERAAQDKKAGIAAKPSNDLMDFDARHAFGFGESGYITVYSGPTALIDDWRYSLECGAVRYNLTFQYYSPSKYNVTDIPAGVIAIRLNWEDVCDHDTRMKPHEEVTRIVANMFGVDSASASTYQGTPGTWLEKSVVITEKTTSESQYGKKHTYAMVDADGNKYVWETGSKNYEVDLEINLKMKVKKHKEIKGIPCTVVWYCKEI